MAFACLLERDVRCALSPAGWNRTTTPIAATGFTLALVMAGLGLGLGLRERASS